MATVSDVCEEDDFEGPHLPPDAPPSVQLLFRNIEAEHSHPHWTKQVAMLNQEEPELDRMHLPPPRFSPTGDSRRRLRCHTIELRVVLNATDEEAKLFRSGNDPEQLVREVIVPTDDLQSFVHCRSTKHKHALSLVALQVLSCNTPSYADVSLGLVVTSETRPPCCREAGEPKEKCARVWSVPSMRYYVHRMPIVKGKVVYGLPVTGTLVRHGMAPCTVYEMPPSQCTEWRLAEQTGVCLGFAQKYRQPTGDYLVPALDSKNRTDSLLALLATRSWPEKLQGRPHTDLLEPGDQLRLGHNLVEQLTHEANEEHRLLNQCSILPTLCDLNFSFYGPRGSSFYQFVKQVWRENPSGVEQRPMVVTVCVRLWVMVGNN